MAESVIDFKIKEPHSMVTVFNISLWPSPFGVNAFGTYISGPGYAFMLILTIPSHPAAVVAVTVYVIERKLPDLSQMHCLIKRRRPCILCCTNKGFLANL